MPILRPILGLQSAQADQIIDRRSITMGNNREVVASFHEIFCHSMPHHSDTDKSDFGHYPHPFQFAIYHRCRNHTTGGE